MAQVLTVTNARARSCQPGDYERRAVSTLDRQRKGAKRVNKGEGPTGPAAEKQKLMEKNSFTHRHAVKEG